MPIMEMVAARSLVVSLALWPLLMRSGGLAALRTRRPFGHLARTLLGFVGMSTSFYGYAILPLATVTALGFAMPLILTLLSVPLLGEGVGWRRASAVAVGLAGVLIMLRPWRDAADALPVGPVCVVFSGVVAWALTMITIRRMGAAGERNLPIVLWYSIGSTVIAAILTVPVWVTPDWLQLSAMLGVGLVSAIAQMLMTEGYRSGETTLVAPFEYGAIVYTTLMGALIWGEYPDGWNYVGIAVLVGAGLYIWQREIVGAEKRNVA
jgi:drug/metabolite transporter (DMT)-like permease